MTAQRFYRMLLCELDQLKNAPMPIITAIILPVLAWTVIALTLQQPVIADIPVTILDLDGSTLSRTIIRQLDATQALQVREITAGEATARASMRNEESSLLIIFPKNMERDIKRGGSTQCLIHANGAQLLYSKIAYRAAVTTVYGVSAAIQMRRFEANGLAPDAALARAMPVSTEIHAPGNSWYDYGFYLVPGMMLAILQMSVSFSALWFFRGHSDRDAKLILPPPGMRLGYFAARGLPLLMANVIAVLLLFLVFFPLAGIGFTGGTPELFLHTLLFVIACLGMGAFLSALFGHLVTAAQIGLIINAPAFVFSGYTFPRWAMPDGIRVFAEFIPLTHLLDGFFPLMIFQRSSAEGVFPLLLFCALFWGGSLLLVSSPGERLRAWETRLAAAVRTLQESHPKC
ncbi:MAG: ABC transporter permease [Bacteroidetes bacterium]|nr:ABC transporter permease [Bacteroidota bacterium]